MRRVSASRESGPGPCRDQLTAASSPQHSNKQNSLAHPNASGSCRYCCKSPKLPGANFLAVKKSDRRPRIDVASITLPRSPASLSSGDEVPHIFTRKSRLWPKEFLIASAKRLLQQNRHFASFTAVHKISTRLEALRT